MVKPSLGLVLGDPWMRLIIVGSERGVVCCFEGGNGFSRCIVPALLLRVDTCIVFPSVF